MLSESLDRMMSHFKTRIHDVQEVLALRPPETDRASANSVITKLLELEETLRGVEKVVESLEENLSHDEDEIQCTEAILKSLRLQQQELSLVKQHCDRNLSLGPSSYKASNGRSNSSQSISSVKNSTRSYDVVSSQTATSSSAKSTKESSRSSSTSTEHGEPSFASEITGAFPTSYESAGMRLLTEISPEEFETLPNHIRGRLTLEKINASIQEINKILKDKFELYKIPSHKLSAIQLKQMEEYEELDDEEVRGKIYFSDNDLKRESRHIKKNATGQAILALLRHSKRIKRASGAKSARYIVL